MRALRQFCVALLLVAALTGTLSACGKRGPLSLPAPAMMDQ